ncbi:unnamed protein product [Lactuca saligna]|uniref:Pentatricopeptide repeat-containing protein n=1 Tax=Lactuca saligna TaxID=75948 RepID=A0AA35Z855_LACSI|nr:unnamed protein product [Lactuca saligna]
MGNISSRVVVPVVPILSSILEIDFGLHESTLDFRGHKRSKQDKGRNGAPNRARQRHDGCDMLMIPITTIVYGLKLSFILCREVPVLFQKVLQLLAMLYTLSPSNKALSMLSSFSSVLSESQWASFFHQASLGTHLNHQLVSRFGKHKDQNTTTDVHVKLMEERNMKPLYLNLAALSARCSKDLELNLAKSLLSEMGQCATAYPYNQLFGALVLKNYERQDTTLLSWNLIFLVSVHLAVERTSFFFSSPFAIRHLPLSTAPIPFYYTPLNSRFAYAATHRRQHQHLSGAPISDD